MRDGFLSAAYGPVRNRCRLHSELGLGAPLHLGSWVIVTAWNPDGQQVPAAMNEQAQQRLQQRIRARYPAAEAVINGCGRWREEALLVPDATLRDAVNWATEFRQAAVVFGVSRRAALVWRDGQVERFWTVPA